MHFNDSEFNPLGKAKTLVIILHAYGLSRASLEKAIAIIYNAYETKGGADIYAPTLPYTNRLDPTGAINLVVKLVNDIDEIWLTHKYDRIIFIGHSLGGILARRLFLAAAPNPPDYSDGHQLRDDLPPEISGNQHEWSAKVERIILLASWDKGWSISARDAWKYTIGLNFLGFWGRFFELFGIGSKPGRTMLDMRLGAPFIVQTRLLWMAYRRWQNKSLRDLYNEAHPLIRLTDPPASAVNPLVVQIIGTKDDFVSPQDQVDNDVEAAEDAAQRFTGIGAQSNKKYFLLEMPGADHRDVVNFTSMASDEYKKTFLCALTGDEASLSECAHNPSYFEDLLTKPDPSVNDVVFVMHGIRDDGYWTHRIAKAIKEAAQSLNQGGIRSWTQTYGYFPMGSFLLPWVRQQKVEWFMDKYVNIKACYPNATMHYVGHSNGTYLAASALIDYPAARFGKIYFAGSVVNPSFDWADMVEKQRVKKFHNARGGTDWVVALLPKSIEYFANLGGAGFDGFEHLAETPETITQSQHFAKGGHSGAISEGHWPEIAKFIVTGDKPFLSGEPCSENGLFDVEQNRWLKFFARFRIGIPFIFSIAALLVLLGFSLWLPFELWRWNVSETTGEWAWPIWIATLTVFLALQFLSKKAPTGITKWISLLLLLSTLIGVTVFVGMSFIKEALEFSLLDPTQFAVAILAAGAVLTVVGLVGLILFILTRF
jgi:pimeloyl-ACP methyl ester carboxylesterase